MTESYPELSVEKSGMGRVNGRAILLGISLTLLFNAINGYLQINMGWSFGYGAIALIAAYYLFHKIGGGSSRRELSFVLITSASSLGVYNSLGLILYLLQKEEGLFLPHWMAPPREIVLSRSIEPVYWLTPVAFITLTTALTMIVGLLFVYVLRNEFIRSEKMVWPYNAAEGSLVDACFRGGGSARLVGIAAAVGLVVPLLQNIPSLMGYDLTSIDLSAFLPRGSMFAISLSIAFAAIGYMISIRTALSVMAAGLITNLIISPILVSNGAISYSPNTMEMYNELVFKFSLGPALGVLLLGGILLSAFMIIKRSFPRSHSGERNSEKLGYLNLYRALVRGIISDRRLLLIVLAAAGVIFTTTWMLDPFFPMPKIYSLLLVAYMFFVGSFVELVIITKMSGETGMSMGVASTFLYDFPLFGSGYRGYSGYWSYPFLRPSPWVSNGTLPYLKYREQFDVTWRDIIKAKATGWTVSILFSIAFTFLLWKYIGFGTPLMPAVSLIQGGAYLKMLATGDMAGTINPWAFVVGGVLGAFLEAFTPVSMIGIGMGLMLPPHYIVPLGLGGLVRLYTEHKFGKKFYDEKGKLISTGLMATSLMVQVVMTVLTKFLRP